MRTRKKLDANAPPKVYNEIYPAEAWANKIHKFLTKVADEKPCLYAKSRHRYKELAKCMKDSLQLISIILEDESIAMMPRSSDEFDEIPEIPSSSGIINFGLPRSLQNEDEPRNYTGDYYTICKQYDQVFKEASVHNFGYSEVNECARLMYRWFHTRFLPDIPDSDFRVQIAYLPTWICSFIIVYGKYYESDKLYEFEKMITRWCDKVQSGQNDNYAIPFDIYRIESDFKSGSYQPKDYTIEAVVIHDILASEALYRLSSPEYRGRVPYDVSTLPNMVKERNPALLNKVRTRIPRRKELIREIGLTPIGGIDIDD